MKSIARLLLSRFSKRYDYDVSYLLEMADWTPGAFLGYLAVAPVSRYRKAAPVPVYYAAKIVAVRRADCGPCLNLVIQMAKEDGVDQATIDALVAGKVDQLSDEVAVGYEFAHAVLDQAALRIEELNQTVDQRWGKAARVDLALAVTFGQFFPTLKRGLGHAQSCSLSPVATETSPQHC